VNEFLDYLLVLLAQFAGGPGPRENNLVRFGLAAILWGALLIIAWSRQRQHELPREKFLVWGFGLGFARELYMFSHVSLRILDVAEQGWVYFTTEPLEHALTIAALVLVAGSFLRYILDDVRLSRRYLQIGLGATSICFLATFWWWPRYLMTNREVKFHQTWGAWLFHVTASVLIAAAIVLLARKRSWLRNVVSVALMFFFLGEFIMLFNFATDKAHAHIVCPIGNSFHIWAIPLLGYVYFREQSIEKKQAEEELEAYRHHLEDLVKERTAELTRANEQLQWEITERKRAEEALRETRDYLDKLIQYANAPIIVWNQALEITRFNRAFEHLTGYSADQVIGKGLSLLFPEAGRDESLQKIALTSIGEHWESVEIPFLRQDGKTRLALWNSANIYAEDGTTLLATIAQGIDITERKRAEEALEQLSRQNELILNSAGEGIFGIDQQGRHIFVNPAAARMLGYKAEELIGQPSHATWHHSKADGSPYPEEECPIHAGYRKGIVRRGDDQVFWRKDGTSFLAEYVSTPIREGGKLAGAVVVFQDITERKQAEAEIAQRNAELALLHETSVFLTSTLDPVTIYHQITEQAAKLLDCQVTKMFLWDEELQEAVGVSSYGPDELGIRELRVQPGESDVLYDLIAHRRSIPIEDGQADPRVPHAWREKFNAKALLCLPVWGKGKPLGFLFVIDQREPRQWLPDEVALAESFVNLAAITLENAHLYKRVEWAAALEERQRIAAEMHDGLAQTLSYLGHKADGMIEQIEARRNQEAVGELHSMRNIIGQASQEVRRSIASLQESPKPRQPLRDLLTEIIGEFAMEGEPRVDLMTRFQAPLFLPQGQLEQVLRVVQEALMNASRHAQAQQVTVRLEKQGDEARITVEDDGQGFDTNVPPADDGDHFGLSIMRARAARIGGRVKIDSAPGQGTRVILTWTLNV
jgi:PAS domain S-box-containing protein